MSFISDCIQFSISGSIGNRIKYGIPVYGKLQNMDKIKVLLRVYGKEQLMTMIRLNGEMSDTNYDIGVIGHLYSEVIKKIKKEAIESGRITRKEINEYITEVLKEQDLSRFA